VPILFYDPKQKVIGAAHSGWAGTISKIARNTIDTMIKKYSSKPEDIIVSIGPAIGPCCYEVKLDVVEKVQTNLNKDKEKIIITRNNKYYFDLCKANKLQLLSSGIPEENIEIAGVCTKCNNHLFFSARKAKKTGRFGAGIMLRKQR
jgi:YfiH family protein